MRKWVGGNDKNTLRSEAECFQDEDPEQKGSDKQRDWADMAQSQVWDLCPISTNKIAQAEYNYRSEQRFSTNVVKWFCVAF